MDIQKWLEETVMPDRPPSSPTLPGQSCPGLFFASQPPGKLLNQGRRRKRSTSDSSLLHARTPPRRSPPIRRHADTSQGGDESNACSVADEPHHSSESSSCGERYARKPRRKTRPERYEPASKDTRRREPRHRPHREKGEPKRSKQKSRRKKTERPGVGLVQSFQAKNVPQERLTLKPQSKLGLFNKGRVSSPVKGRGLPDLVFSEMRFLQKQRTQPEAVPGTRLPEKKRKKGHADAQQDEISAYFSTVRPTLAEKDMNTQAREVTLRGSLSQGGSTGRERPLGADNAIPTVEPQDNAPCFGPSSGIRRFDSGSYVPWSESIRVSSAAPTRGPTGPVITGQLDAARTKENRLDAAGGQTLHSRTPPSAFRHLAGRSHEPFPVSSSVPANHRDDRSHSVPHPRRSTCLSGIEERSKVQGTIDRTISAPLMPVEAPHCPDQPSRGEDVADAERIPKQKPEGRLSRRDRPSTLLPDMEGRNSNKSLAGDDHPDISSTLGRLLRECNSAFDEYPPKRLALEGPNRRTPHLTAISGKEQQPTEADSYMSLRTLPTVRFSGVEVPRPIVPNCSGRSIYQEQERRNHVTRTQFRDEVEDGNTWSEAPLGGRRIDALEELELDEPDVDYAFEELDWADPETTAAEWDFETPLDSIFGQYQANVSRLGPGQSEDVVASGFWRPNKLY